MDGVKRREEAAGGVDIRINLCNSVCNIWAHWLLMINSPLRTKDNMLVFLESTADNQADTQSSIHCLKSNYFLLSSNVSPHKTQTVTLFSVLDPDDILADLY